MTTQTMDAAKAEAFGGKVVGIMNGASLAFMISIGHRTGLFDAMAGMRPSTSEQIAAGAGLNERYVREWLGAMLAGGVVEYDAATKKYELPPEHAASLTRAAGPGNLASFAQFFSEVGNVESGIVGAFQNGGGVPYSQFPRFQELMREESAGVFDATLIDVTLPLASGLVERLRSGIDVADVGCGAGHAINLMAKAFPKSRFTGYDFSDEGVARGRAEAKEWGLTNATFEVKDVATLDGLKQFDLITTFDSIHDQAWPRRVLKGIYDALKPGGTYLCVDIAASSEVHENKDHPLGAFLYTISTMHCMTVSLALGGEGLGTAWGEQKARELMTEAGFRDISVTQVEGDIMNNYYITTK
jgi:ubiquinone/menaquinone biosynthesis C-methylase UbiE